MRTRKTMKNYRLLFILPLIIMTLGSCLKDDDYDGPDLPTVSLYNFYPKANGIQYVINGSPMTDYNPNYKGISLFLAIPGNKTMEILDRQSNEVIIDTSLTFADSVYYSCFVYGTIDDPAFIRVPDEGLEDLGTKAGVRFLHLGHGAGKVSLKIGDQEIEGLTDREYETTETVDIAKLFKPANSGQAAITVIDENGETVAKVDNLDLVQGRHYNFILNGSKDDSEYPLELSYSFYN